MNYQLLLEVYSKGSKINKTEAEMLDIELYAQIESIKRSGSNGYLHVAPDHICAACLLCKGSLWISCLAAFLDMLMPVSSREGSRGRKVFNELARNSYLITD